MMATGLQCGRIELGCGLIGIGRHWGVRPTPVPTEKEAQEFLEAAFAAGIRFFDTAPAYGSSEERLGRFIGNLTPTQRAEVTVATKCGEVFLPDGQTSVDHSPARLCESIERSLSVLGRISVVQLHKSTAELLRNENLKGVWEFARRHGISDIGASVSDLETASLALELPEYRFIQLPYNQDNSKFDVILRDSLSRKKKLLLNRPFAMGQLIVDGASGAAEKAFEFILRSQFDGVVLTGTKDPVHLAQNIHAFQAACRDSAQG